jgi:hypothetical protein
MTSSDKKGRQSNQTKSTRKTAKKEKLAAALRRNLLRRKNSTKQK